LEELLRHPNVLGIKAFLSPLSPNAGYQAVTPKQLLEVAKLCGSFSKPILVHSELMTLKELDDSMQSAFPCDGSCDNSYDAHVKSRPTKWEQDAFNLVVECTNYCDMHVVHLSDAIGCLPIIERAKEEIYKSNGSKRKLTVETCPHYLLLDSNLIQDGDTKVKCFPQIREKEQRLELWRGLSSGLIDIIASDHSPCEPYMRK
jgi:allantoinase